jgi:plastocyanin
VGGHQRRRVGQPGHEHDECRRRGVVTTRDAHGNPRNGVSIDWAVGTFAATAGAPVDIAPDMTSGSASRTFTVAGTFNYSCTNHPGMNGSVTVTP